MPLVKPRSIDDVPILALTLSSKRYGDFELRGIAAQVHDAIKQVPDVSTVTLIGGQRREVRIVLDPGKLAAYGLAPLQVAGGLGLSNRRLPSGQFDTGNREYLLETGEFLRTAEDVRDVVVGVSGEKPVFVRNVAEVTDGGEEPAQYVRMARAGAGEFLPAVTIAVAKRKGHQRGHRCGERAAPHRAAEGHGDSGRRPGGDHAPLRRNGGGEIERTAVPHADRGGVGEYSHRHHAGIPRIADRVHRHSGDAGAHPGGVLSLRLHAEPHHAVRADFLDRHPGR